MKSENDMANYFEDLWFLTAPLLGFDYLSKKECHELFLQGFHPGDWAKLSPNLERQVQDLVQMMKTMILQCLGNELPALPTLSSAHASLPPAPEMLASPTDFVASTLALHADLLPMPSPASNLVASPPSLG